MIEDLMIERNLVVPADRESTWRAITEPEVLDEWFGSTVEWDLRPGGSATFHDHDGSTRRGQVDDVQPGRGLTFRWWPEADADQASEVTYELEAEPEGTRLRVTERRLAAEDSAPTSPVASAMSGWTPWDSRMARMWMASVAGALAGCASR